MHFDGIEPGVDGQLGRVGVRGDHFVDVVAAGLLGEPHADRVEEPHRGQRGGVVGAGVGDRAGMPDLRADCRALGVDRVGEPPEPRHCFGAHPDPVAFGAAALRDRAVGDGGHADPARGRQPVVLDQFVADQRTWRAGFEGRGFDDAVAQRDGPELRRCQHVRGFGHGAGSAGNGSERTARGRACQTGRRGCDHIGRQNHARRDLRRPERAGGRIDRGGADARPGHRPGRRRPGVAGLRPRKARRLRQGGHHLTAPRPARRHQPGEAQRHHRRTQRQPRVHRLHRPVAAAEAAGRERGFGARRSGQGCRRVAPDEPGPAGA